MKYEIFSNFKDLILTFCVAISRSFSGQSMYFSSGNNTIATLAFSAFCHFLRVLYSVILCHTIMGCSIENVRFVILIFKILNLYPHDIKCIELSPLILLSCLTGPTVNWWSLATQENQWMTLLKEAASLCQNFVP